MIHLSFGVDNTSVPVDYLCKILILFFNVLHIFLSAYLKADVIIISQLLDVMSIILVVADRANRHLPGTCQPSISMS